MTGEVTLRGRVLPIGGLKEKALAALRAGIDQGDYPRAEPKGSGRDPRGYPQEDHFYPVKDMDEVIELALGKIKKQHERNRGAGKPNRAAA